jgi:hypothetical protein
VAYQFDLAQLDFRIAALDDGFTVAGFSAATRPDAETRYCRIVDVIQTLTAFCQPSG